MATQQWMQAAILARSASGAATQLRSDNRLTSGARLAIYADAYRLRLLECLRAEYPILAALAGPTAFDLFALGYIAAHPSRSYTLYDYGAGFADYLDAVRPAGDGTPQALEAIPAALARIERARAEVSRAEGLERLRSSTGIDPTVAAMLDMLGLGMGSPWRPDSVRLLALPFDFTETLAAAERGETPLLPAPEPSFVAVARMDYRVFCYRLEPWQYHWIEAVTGDGAPVAEPRLADWLPQAVRQGLIAFGSRP